MRNQNIITITVMSKKHLLLISFVSYFKPCLLRCHQPALQERGVLPEMRVPTEQYCFCPMISVVTMTAGRGEIKLTDIVYSLHLVVPVTNYTYWSPPYITLFLLNQTMATWFDLLNHNRAKYQILHHSRNSSINWYVIFMVYIYHVISHYFLILHTCLVCIWMCVLFKNTFKYISV
jgi:hypothetical protein